MAMGKPFPDFKLVALADEALAQFEGVYQIAGKPPRTVTRVGEQLRQQAGSSQIVRQPFGDSDFFLQGRGFTHYRFE